VTMLSARPAALGRVDHRGAPADGLGPRRRRRPSHPADHTPLLYHDLLDLRPDVHAICCERQGTRAGDRLAGPDQHRRPFECASLVDGAEPKIRDRSDPRFDHRQEVRAREDDGVEGRFDVHDICGCTRRTADPIAPNVLHRNFDVALPNVAWVTDVTYVPTHEGWLYLAAILDLCSRRVVGWAASANNDRELALDALARATSTRTPSVGLIHHSDRGSVYASGDYRDALDDLGAVRSMSRKGDCWDNAVAESFFATIKGEMVDHQDFQTRAEATAAIADYIDAFYNVERMHSSIGYVSPIEFELKLQSKREAA